MKKVVFCPYSIFGFLLSLNLGFLPIATAQDLSTESGSLSLTSPGPIGKSELQKNITWSMEVSGEKRQDEFSNQKSESALGLKMTFDFTFNSWLGLYVKPLITSRSGYVQSLETKEAEGTSIEVLHAAVEIKPYDGGSIMAGALNQQQSHSTLMMKDRSFPGARLTFGNSLKSINQIGLFGESAIPTGSSSTNSSQDREASPSLTTRGLFYNLSTTNVKWKNKIGRYLFKNLPLSVSTKSVLLGNTGVSTSGADMKFATDFEGTELQSELEVFFSKIDISLRAEATRNDQATQGSNEALLGKIGCKYRLNKTWAIAPEYTYFRIQEDSVVAYYNSTFQNSNYAGYKGGMSLEWAKTIRFKVLGGERIPLVEKTTQSRESTIQVSMETLDAAI